MKVEKIHDRKISVYISNFDLKERNIDKNEFYPENLKVQSLFLDILEEAYLQEDFDTEGHQLYVEATSLLNNGFKITITKFTNDGEECKEHNSTSYIFNEIHEFILKTEYETITTNELLFSFSSIENISPCMNFLEKYNFAETSLYELDGVYILTLIPSNPIHETFSNIIAFLSEYGIEEDYSIPYVDEHGKRILYKNALESLKKYFKII